MAVFLKITALWVQGHAYLIQAATYMAPYPRIPHVQLSLSITEETKQLTESMEESPS